VTSPQKPRSSGLLAELLHPEARLLPRLTAVFRLDPQVYREIADDPGSIPQAFGVVIATSFVVGIGQLSLAGAFVGAAWTLVMWLLVAALIWGAGTLVVGERSHYAPLLRCLGFAYAWFVLFIGYELPLIGGLFGFSAVGLCLASNVLAVRAVMDISTERAVGLCAAALGAPLVLLWALFAS
jgi:hypothetical protein